MRRRDFVGLLGSFAAAWPLKAEERQQLRTIAIIGNTTQAYGPWAAAFVERLGQLGWIEGRTLQIEYRWSEGRRERVAEIASELVSKKVDLIVTYGGAAVICKQATTSIPIVFVPGVDPVAAGLVANFAHPGGNVTGMSVQQADIASKRLELLRGTVPGLSRLAILFDANYPASVREADNLETAVRQFGITLLRSGVRVVADLEPAFDAFKSQVDAVYLADAGLLDGNRARVVSLVLDTKLPTSSSISETARAGALMAYGPDYPDLFRRAAEVADKIMRGAKPGDIPVEQPTKFYLVINLKSAKALGLTVPNNVLALADEVIE
jgi:putative tryptophan/tyrosine transport system substrate-binding protein